MADVKTILDRLNSRPVGKASSPLDRLRAREAAKSEPPTADCLADVPYTGNAEADSEAELSATLKAFKDRAKQEEKRRLEATDSEFWVCVCFQTRAQKEEFLTKLGLIADGDKYLDGQRVAEAVGVELTPANIVFRDARIDRKWQSLAIPLPSES